MSYSILYRSMFVKMSDGKYIPMYEVGDNNVWECDNKRRARSWYQADCIAKGKVSLTEDEIMAGVENLINSVKNQYVGKVVEDYNGGDGVRTYTDKEIESRFGYYEGISIYGKSTRVTTANQIRNFFKKGIERAVPFGEISLNVHWCVKYPDYERRYPKTEDEFFAAVKEGQDGGHQVWIGFCDPWDVERLWNKMKRETTRKKVKVERTTGYVVTCDYRYLISAGSRNFKVNPYLEYAHVYPSFANAEKMQKRILRTYKSEIFEVIKVNGRWQLKSETEAS